LLNLTKIVMLR